MVEKKNTETYSLSKKHKDCKNSNELGSKLSNSKTHDKEGTWFDFWQWEMYQVHSPYCERLRRSDTMKLFKWCAMDIVEFLTFLTLFSIFSAVWPHGWPVIIGLYNLCCHDASSDVHSINALVHLVVPWNFANSKLMFNVFLLLFDYVIDLD